MKAIVDNILIDSEVESTAFGVVVARGCQVEPDEASLTQAIDEIITKWSQTDATPDTIGRVRKMLRHGKYKPTGRGKPASEYLLKAARNDRFPRINNLVDLGNFVSLKWTLPLSLVDLDRAQTNEFLIRHGREGEDYVFNPGGQVIDLQDLLLISGRPSDQPLANPIKDSMTTKLNLSSQNIMAILYVPRTDHALLESALGDLKHAFSEWGFAKKTTTATLI